MYGEQAPDQWQLFDVDDVYKMSGAWGKGWVTYVWRGGELIRQLCN